MWVYYALMLLILLLCSCRLMCSKTLNDFYKVYFFSWRYPLVALHMDKSVKKRYPLLDERLRRLNRCTISLCKALPKGTYKALTHDRVIEALEHMQAKGKVEILKKQRSCKPRKQKALMRHVCGWYYPTKQLPLLQNYKIVFKIL